MRPVSQTILILLISALCSLCVWQWWRESNLREITVQQLNEISKLTTERQEMESRVKETDVEILRLTTNITDLRINSVSKEAMDEQIQSNKRFLESMEKQSSLLKRQNESIAKQNEALTTQNNAIKQANETIKKLSEDRDRLVKQLNEVTTLYNKLAQTNSAKAQ